MADIAEARLETDRVDLFAAAHDITEAQLVAWNRARFVARPYFWLWPGERLWIVEPPDTGSHLLVPDRRLVTDGALLTVETEDAT